MNRLQRQIRIISDAELDDSAGEMDTCDHARHMLEITRLALMDGMVITTEAASILAAQLTVVRDCDDSLARNVAIQQQLDGAIAKLATLPATRAPRAEAA